MKIALIGYGKMGKAIDTLAASGQLFGGEKAEIVLRIGSANRPTLSAEQLQVADVAIEFSTPGTAVENIGLCLQAGIPVVTGTTGWFSALSNIQQQVHATNGALVYATNFSIGVNIFMEINRQLAGMMSTQPQYEVQISETHHTQKLDAPSGTAITIAEAILQQLPGERHWVNHASNKANELPIISHREGNVPGTHTVLWESDADSIELVHTAHSRQGFAEGALLAAAWILHKKGCFTMREVLGF